MNKFECEIAQLLNENFGNANNQKLIKEVSQQIVTASDNNTRLMITEFTKGINKKLDEFELCRQSN